MFGWASAPNTNSFRFVVIPSCTEILPFCDEHTPIGLEDRTSLLTELSAALQSSSLYFGQDARPGTCPTILRPTLPTSGDKRVVKITDLLNVLIKGLAPLWPTNRTTIRGVRLTMCGPVRRWRKTGVSVSSEGRDALVPFHKLSQWLAYSLIEPIEKLLGWEFDKMGTSQLVSN